MKSEMFLMPVTLEYILLQPYTYAGTLISYNFCWHTSDIPLATQTYNL